MEVSSHFEGRIRIRDEGLKKEPLLAKAREALLAMPGVSGVEANPRVGSLLILYAAAVTAVQKMMKTLSEILGSREVNADPVGSAPASGRIPLVRRVSSAIPSVLKKRILNNIGMLVSLGISLGAAVFYLKKLHVLAGIIFVGMFGIHLFERRMRVFA
jgi:hypothetical protein